MENTTAAATADSGDVNNKAVLVNLTSTKWTARKKDTRAARSATAAANADADAGSFYKALMPRAYTAPITAAYNAVYACIMENTLPYAGKLRVLPLTNYDRFTQSIGPLVSAFHEAADILCAHYGELIAQAPRRLGALYDARDFPPAEMVRDKFTLSVGIMPLPAATQFADVFGLSDTERQRLEQQAADTARAALGDAVRAAFMRLFTVIQDFAETMRDADKIFRDTKVTNISRLLDVLPALNVTNDAELTARIMEARQLVRYDAQQLRENETARKLVADEADAILARMAAIL